MHVFDHPGLTPRDVRISEFLRQPCRTHPLIVTCPEGLLLFCADTHGVSQSPEAVNPSVVPRTIWNQHDRAGPRALTLIMAQMRVTSKGQAAL